MKTVFCDESGFTGENLWQLEQPHFVYAAVCVPEEEAAEIVEATRRKYAIKATELHAARMMKREKGRIAVLDVVESLVSRSSVAVFHKRYSLAGKMFEYLIEPAISAGNSLFYDIGFHKFVATGLYLALLSEPSTTEQTFVEFQQLMRSGDVSRLDAMANGMSPDGLAGFLGQVATFITCNRKALHEEIAASEDYAGLPRWIIELTLTALRTLLAPLSGRDMLPLSVTCDESKPLLSQAESFDAFVGRTDHHEIYFDGRANQIAFNLAHKIRLESSATTQGLQLADLVAGAAASALKNPEDEFAQHWRETCTGAMHRNSVLPDLDEVDLGTERAVVNAIVLHELVERSVRGQSLLLGMREFIEFAQESAPRILLENAGGQSWELGRPPDKV